jgi:putative glutamine amidotransferase
VFFVRKPIILVTPSYEKDKSQLYILDSYISSLINAGATPLIVPYGLTRDDISSLGAIADGYLFSGGPDVHPNLYGESVSSQCGPIVPSRDALELQLFQQAYTDQKPIFGICRGFQMINVCLGGTLHQDLKAAGFCSISHHDGPYPEFAAMHTVSFPDKSLFWEHLNAEQVLVNSYHHQCVKQLAPSLTALAFSDDGITEAAYDESRRFLLGVQWHPERLDDSLTQFLWTSFVNAARS